MKWSRRVDRIVLLGSPNGGFRFRGFSWLRVLYALAVPFADFALEQVHSGRGYWVTNMRLRWLDVYRRRPGDPDKAHANNQDLEIEDPLMVDVVGMADRLVTSDDMHDSLAISRSWRLEIADTDHAGLVDISDGSSRRWEVISRAIWGKAEDQSDDIDAAFTADGTANDSMTVLSPGVDDGPTTNPDQTDESTADRAATSKNVLFIFHGIRATADDGWIATLRERLGMGMMVVAPDTGFFSAWEFALPFTRNRKTHDFLETYARAARHHDPLLHIPGPLERHVHDGQKHAEKVPAVRFRSILLAGTVLEPSFDWQKLVDRHQIGTYDGLSRSGENWKPGEVHNERVRVDFPVGIIAVLNGLKPWNRGVGPGGVIGFPNAPDVVRQDVKVYTGGHAGAFTGLHGEAPPNRIQITLRSTVVSNIRLAEIEQFVRDGRYGGANESEHHPPELAWGWFKVISRIARFAAWPIVVALGIRRGLGDTALRGTVRPPRACGRGRGVVRSIRSAAIHLT